MPPTDSRTKTPSHIRDLHTRVRRRRRKVFFIVFSSTVILLLVCGWWVIFQSGALLFQTIRVEGNTRLTDQEVVRLLEQKLITPHFLRRSLGKNHFLAWPMGVDQATMSTLGNIRRVSLSKDYWHRTLTIRIEERQFLGTLCARQNDIPQCLWFDKEGFFFEEAFFPDGFLVFHIDDYSRPTVKLGEFIYSKNKTAKALALFKMVDALALPVSEWTVKKEAPETFEVRLVNGPVIYFNLSVSPQYAAQVIQSLIGQRGIQNIQYIDFRTEGRVYYKDN